MEPMDRYQELSDWIEGAIRHHHKQQWQQSFAKDPNAMDTLAGCTRAQAAMTEDERNCLMKEGRCFNCKNTGHRSRECPDKKNCTQTRLGKQRSPLKIRKKPLVL